MRRGGFDAVVSNPPFMGGQKLTGQLGEDLREYLIQDIGRGKRGSADLCSYFLLRDLAIAPHGRTGIIATNTIAQGDTREVGLDQVVDMGWAVYRAEKSQRWPGTASLEVALLWTGHPGSDELSILDGNRVAGITPSLDPESRMHGNPYRLASNSGQSFQGSITLGAGFILEPEQARDLIRKDARNKAILFPYLSGEDLNSRWDFSARRWIINFHDWPRIRAESYVDCYERVLRLVKPERDVNKYSKGARENWWLYERSRPELYNAIAGLDRVLAITLHTKTGLPVSVHTGQVFSHGIGVFATDRASDLALISSSIHFFWWTTKGGSTLETRLRYTPSDGFETFSTPDSTSKMDAAGKVLDTFRQTIMERNRYGLTDLYNRVNDETDYDDEIVQLREIHVEVDQAVRDAYALDEEREPAILNYEATVTSAQLPLWREIELGHGFHETRQGIRFTISAQARADVLDKLLVLNHYRYEQEVKQGLHSGKRPGASRKKGAGRAPSGTVPTMDDGGLFPPEGTLF